MCSREAPKFEIFCVITCGLTTHKISIAAPAEGAIYTLQQGKLHGGTFRGMGGHL